MEEKDKFITYIIELSDTCKLSHTVSASVAEIREMIVMYEVNLHGHDSVIRFYHSNHAPEFETFLYLGDHFLNYWSGEFKSMQNDDEGNVIFHLHKIKFLKPNLNRSKEQIENATEKFIEFMTIRKGYIKL